MKISKVVCGVLAGLALSSASFAKDNDLNDVSQIEAVNLDDDIAKAEKEKQVAEEKQDENRRNLETLKEHKMAQESKKDEANRLLPDKRSKAEGLNQDIATQDAEIMRNSSSKQNSERLLGTAEARLNEENMKLQVIENEIQRLTNDKNSAEQTLQESGNQKRDALQRAGISGIDDSSTKETLNQKKQEIDTVGITSNEVEDDTTKKDEAIDKLIELKQKGIVVDGVDELKKSTDMQPSSKSDIDAALTKAKERIDALNTAIEKLTAIEQETQKITQFDEQIEEKNNDKRGIQTTKEAIEADKSRHEQDINRFQQAIQNAQEQKNNLQTQLTQTQQEIRTLESQLQDAERQVQTLNDQINNLNDAIKKQEDKIAKISKKIEDAKNKRDLEIRRGFNAQQQDVLNSLLDLKDNDLVDEVIMKGTTEQISEFVKSNAMSINQALQSLNAGFQTEIVKFSSDLSTNTRLAKLSNPFNSDLALAYAVKNLSGEMFADNGDSMSSVVKYYTDRFNYDNNLWGNIIGAKGKVKDGGNPELYGFTLGYDKAFDDTIFGAFITYAKSKVNYDRVKNEADNYQIGVYTRTYMDNHEIDAKFSVGVAKNELDRSVKVGANTLNQTGKYNSTFTSFNLDYGYVISIDDATFVKPIVGLSHSFVKNKEFREKGDLPLHYKANRSRILNVKLASEFRKYVSDGSYLYVAPGLERELYKRVDDSVVRFIGSNKDIIFTNNGKKSTYFTVQTGADFKLTENLSTNINFGAKVKSKNQFYNGNIGLRYKF